MAYMETTTLKRLLDWERFYRIMQGGMSSGKTESALIALIGYAQSYSGKRITITTDTYRNLTDGAHHDFKHILQEQKLDKWFDYRATDRIYTYIPNGSQIEFMAMDDPMKARGARRDVLYVNEANRIQYDTFDQLASRTRDFVIIDYNPSSRFWAHDELLAKYRDECDFGISTYMDNEALSDSEVRNIERHDRTSNWWRVYGLGQIGELEDNIYSGWKTVSELPEDANLCIYGLDFGDHPDPTAMVGIWRTADAWYFKQLLYQADTLVSDLGSMIESIVDSNGDRPIVCDYGGGGSTLIRQLQSQNLQAIPADKSAPSGGSSVLLGISELQQCRNVHIIGKDIEREYLSYQHRKTAGGVVLPAPKDGNDHLMDALRYGFHLYSNDEAERQESLARARLYADGTPGEMDNEW